MQEVLKSHKIKRNTMISEDLGFQFQLFRLDSIGLFCEWPPWIGCSWTPQNILDSLVRKIKEVMGSLEKDTMDTACNRFMSRIEAVVAAGGNFKTMLYLT
jgi:hypothetical protein